MRYLSSQTNVTAAVRDLASRAVRSRVMAAEALGRAVPGEHDRASVALRPLLDDDSPDVRYAAALALGRLGDREAVDRLIHMAQQDEEPMPRQAALAALGDIGDPRATETLCEILTSPLADMRFQAVAALPRVAPELAPGQLSRALDDTDPEVRAGAAAALGDLRHLPARDRLAEMIRGEDDLQVQLEAAAALARMGDRRGTEVLVRLLSHRDFRLLAAEHLFLCPDPAARQRLQAALYRWLSPPLLKVWAAAALTRLGDLPARQRLVKLLRHRAETVRGLTIQVLGAIDQPWSRDTLESLLEPREAVLFGGWREEIVQALGPRVRRPALEPPSA